MVRAWATLACALALSIVQSGRPAAAKVFERCELAQLLQQRHQLPRPEIALWVCIAQHTSGFNTTAHAGSPAHGGSHGLFQISDVYWCSPPGRGLGCNVACSQLRDDDLTDDLACAQQIRAEHQRITGDGYTAWQAYEQYCRRHDEAATYIDDCFGAELQASSSHAVVNYLPSQPAGRRAKIYNRCELAQELYYQHQMPMQEIPTWVCIAQHESNFDTSAVGRLNADGSADHGLFQISDLYWCSHELRQGGKACGLACSKLLDDDITDDVRCIKRIHREHTHISGDGFTAWTVYNRDCRHQVYEHVATCFDKSHEGVNQHPTAHHPNAIDGTPAKAPANPFLAAAAARVQPQHTTSHSYGHNPFLRQPQHPNALPALQRPQQQQGQGKVYKRCELAQEMYFKHKVPMQEIPTWVCIAKHESSFDTAAVGRLNADGSEDHGLFQISDRYWCTHDHWGGKGCGLPCDKLVDGDLADDVHCIRTIHDEHTRISGDGFTAWVVYDQHCRAESTAKIVDCFDEQIIRKESAALAANSGHTSQPATTSAIGKVYKRCELAQELYYQHKMPMQEIPTWVCIAKYESSFNTAAVGRLNADGSADHGLFQISDLYWCDHTEDGGKACNLPCHKLLDNDISDDVHCIKIIHAEHTRISGDGFNAWTVYQPHCRNQLLTQLSDCFHGNEIDQAMVHEQHQQPEHDYAAQATTTTSLSVSRPPSALIPEPIPNHPYANNLFLNRIKVNAHALQQEDKVTSPTIHSTQFVSNHHPLGHRPYEDSAGDGQIKASYSGNPFLNKKVVATKLNSEPDYSANPFLSAIRFNSQPTSATTTTKRTTQRPNYTTIKPILTDKNHYGPTHSKQPSVRPVGNYISSDVFRHTNSNTTTTTISTEPTSGLTSVRPHSVFSYGTARPTAVRYDSTTTRTISTGPTKGLTSVRPHSVFSYGTTRPTTTTRIISTGPTSELPSVRPQSVFSYGTARPTAVRYDTTTTRTISTEPTSGIPSVRPHSVFSYGTARPTTTTRTISTGPTSGIPYVRPHSVFSYGTARPTAVRYDTTTTRTTTARTKATTTRRLTTTVKPATTRSTTSKSIISGGFSTSKHDWTTRASTSKPTTTRSTTTTSSTVRPTPARTFTQVTNVPPTVGTATKFTTSKANQQHPHWQWAWHATSTQLPLVATRKTTTTTTQTTPKTTKTTTKSAFNLNKENKQNANVWSYSHKIAAAATTTTTAKPKINSVTIAQTPSAYNIATKTTTTTTTKSPLRTTTATRKPTKITTLAAAPSTTTRKPTTASVTTRKTNAPTTTTTTNINITKINSNPFDHPFFAKVKEKFDKKKINDNNHNNFVIHSTVQLHNKTNTNDGTLVRNAAKTVSPYYEKYRLNANESAKTIFSYAFGQNRTFGGGGGGGGRFGSGVQEFKQTTTSTSESKLAKTTITTRQPRNLVTATTRSTTKAPTITTKSWQDNPMYTTTTRTTNIFDLYLNWNKRLG